MKAPKKWKCVNCHFAHYSKINTRQAEQSGGQPMCTESVAVSGKNGYVMECNKFKFEKL